MHQIREEAGYVQTTMIPALIPAVRRADRQAITVIQQAVVLPPQLVIQPRLQHHILVVGITTEIIINVFPHQLLREDSGHRQLITPTAVKLPVRPVTLAPLIKISRKALAMRLNIIATINFLADLGISVITQIRAELGNTQVITLIRVVQDFPDLKGKIILVTTAKLTTKLSPLTVAMPLLRHAMEVMDPMLLAVTAVREDKAVKW